MVATCVVNDSRMGTFSPTDAPETVLVSVMGASSGDLMCLKEGGS